MRWLLAMLLLPSSAFAQEMLGDDLIDFDRLLLENADKVVETIDPWGNPARTLDLGDGQSITCTDMGCSGTGLNSGLGCDWALLTTVRGLAAACSVPTSNGLEALQGLHKRMSAHVARNAYPPRDPTEIEGRYLLLVEAFGTASDAEQAEACKELSSEGMFRGMIEGLSDPKTVAEIDGRLLSPGLPFVGHCL